MSKTKFPPRPVLLVDDEPHALKSIEIALRSIGINNIIICQDSREVSSIVPKQEIEVMLLDIIMPHVSGEEILGRTTREHPEILVIMATGVNDVDTAVRCMQSGAFDYILKPVKKDRLATSINRAIEMRRLRRENTAFTRHFFNDTIEKPEIFANIISNHKKMRSICQYCEVVAEGREPVLVMGETGTGKELIAVALHDASGREGNFVAVNVAGLDDNVFSDTLFGHKKGAFTGADQQRNGLIEKAAGGTLFLDEIGDLSEMSQVKLLRLLQEREYFPLGSDVPKPTDARTIVATHKDINSLMDDGKFRKDLYYRLRTHRIHIPPLRERMDDIPFLLDYFLEEASEEFGKKKPAYHPELVNLLNTYDFPGNVRELRSMVFDAMASHKSRMLSMNAFKSIIHADISPDSGDSGSPETGDNHLWASGLKKLPTLKEADHILIEEAMKRASNNQRIAASMLGISHQALNKRLKRSSD
ncbi:MAG: sigma-54-dependent Fis family transcriptional regulator [Desulfobacterales bacterium]|nr:sigma-54-dependent Fis family transcriptional regulator [Desulfobacterales bacterium]